MRNCAKMTQKTRFFSTGNGSKCLFHVSRGKDRPLPRINEIPRKIETYTPVDGNFRDQPFWIVGRFPVLLVISWLRSPFIVWSTCLSLRTVYVEVNTFLIFLAVVFIRLSVFPDLFRNVRVDRGSPVGAVQSLGTLHLRCNVWPRIGTSFRGCFLRFSFIFVNLSKARFSQFSIVC